MSLTPRAANATTASQHQGVWPLPGDWQIQINGQPVIWGHDSIRVVYFNLSGRNFENPAPWQSQTYDQYLGYMQSQFPGDFLPGQTMQLLSPEGRVEAEHKF